MCFRVHLCRSRPVKMFCYLEFITFFLQSDKAVEPIVTNSIAPLSNLQITDLKIPSL